MKQAKNSQVIGPVVDVVFDGDYLPRIKEALTVEVEGKKLVMEVAKHMGGRTVRCILLDAAEKMKNSIPCTACRYCCDGCPMGLDIPDLLHKYNQLRVGSGSSVKMQLEALPKDKWPGACIACGACAAVCPQKIAIPDELAAFAAELDKLPSWAEICKARAEAERQEKASRGL